MFLCIIMENVPPETPIYHWNSPLRKSYSIYLSLKPTDYYTKIIYVVYDPAHD